MTIHSRFYAGQRFFIVEFYNSTTGKYYTGESPSIKTQDNRVELYQQQHYAMIKDLERFIKGEKQETDWKFKEQE